MSTIAVMTSAYTYFTTGESPITVRGQIDRGEMLRCFWYLSHGQRCTEDFLFTPEDVKIVRTESDD